MKNLVYGCFLLIFVGCSSTAQTTISTGRPVFLDGTITVASDLVSVDGMCYTVNVRVYLTLNGEKFIIANSNVQVGTCTKRLGSNLNSDCPDQLFRGDYFYYSKDKYKYCLVDLLYDEVTYSKYVIEKNRVINSIKK